MRSFNPHFELELWTRVSGSYVSDMRSLIVGSTGAIGRATAQFLERAGHEVLAVSRSKAPTQPHGVEHIQADRSNASAIAEIARERRVDVVIDLLAFTLPDSVALLSALGGVISRYIMISSCDVYRNYGLLHRKEAGSPDLGEIDEYSQLRQSRYPYRGKQPRAPSDPQNWMDDYDKIPIEEAVRRIASEWVILRLPMVFGPGDPQRRFRWAIAPMLANAPALEAPTSWAGWTTTYGYVDNIGAAIAAAVERPNAARDVFNIGDTDPVDHRAWIRRLQDATSWSGSVRENTGSDSPFAKSLRHLDLQVPLKVSTTKLRRELGFAPPIGLEAALQATIADEASRG